MERGSQCTHFASTPAGILLSPLTSAQQLQPNRAGDNLSNPNAVSPPHTFSPQPPNQIFCLHHNSITAEFHVTRKSAPNFLPESELFDPDLQGVCGDPSKATRLLPAFGNSACSLLQCTPTDMRMNNTVLSHSTAYSILRDVSQGASWSTYPKETALSPQTCECHWRGKQKAQGQCRNCLLCHQMPNCCQVPD